MDKKRHIAIFTTASLPWMTGTAVNPLFRAAFLSKDERWNVTLVIPWLTKRDQEYVYPNKITFDLPSEQENFVRQWLDERIGFKSTFRILFYPGKFSRKMRSIFGVGDITEIIPDEEAEIAVLEEPEHLTWYHHGKGWKAKFCLVVGVVHTNYLEYVKREKNGRIQAFLVKNMNTWVVNIYCHKVIRLSAATQKFPRSVVCNVHGVNPKFLEIGSRKKEQQEQLGSKAFTKGAYYIGKMVWNKGYKELLKLLCSHQKELKELEIDLYGSGEDSVQVQEAFEKLDIKVQVHPGRDHADPVFHDYKVFLNPSTTDVVCTTTAEALAMGKLVVCANHPSNDFFKQFPNCQMYDDGNGFLEATCKSLAQEPTPLSDAERHELSWEAATERFLRSAELDTALIRNKLPEASKLSMSKSYSILRNLEVASALMHYMGTGLVSSQPDEKQRKELGLATPCKQKEICFCACGFCGSSGA
ncbi:Digalactosyldiacylglycerol synthase [Heracleum sosnowskyi]|uniref:Digalactosyldiacylglycerol synthase 2, chloroplastic n=1 Tax=Heracleum sosnowskyi TaxID=360622 RepID=A0AAD8MM08_9APIA|nr:Digalactosyldiacylglycerol synthase [Heracleum sosnowskyi]